GVGLQAAAGPAPAGAAARDDGGVPPLHRAGHRSPVGGPVGDDARAHPRADQADDGVLGRAPRAEPQLRLAHRPGAVVDVQRQAGPRAEQPFQGNRVPAEALPVDAGVGLVLHDAGNADPDAEDGRRADATARQHLVEAGQDGFHDHAGVVLPGIKRVVHLRALGQGQVEQLDPDPDLAQVDPDDVSVVRVHLQQDPRPAAVRVDGPGLDHDALVDQLTDDVADRRRAEPGDLAEIRPALRLLEEQRGQQDRAVVATQVADGPPPSLTHASPKAPSFTRPYNKPFTECLYRSNGVMRYALLLPERDALRPARPGRLDERLLRRLRRLRGGSWRHQLSLTVNENEWPGLIR